MRVAIAVILAVHGAIHFMGFGKAFGYASLPQLTQPISRGIGAVWLIAGILVLISAALLIAWPRYWWIAGIAALVISQAVIISAWRDAWAGAIANVLLLVAVTVAWLTEGPRSFRAQFDRDVAIGLARHLEAPLLKESDLVRLPAPVQRYLRATGFVGQPRIRNYRLRFRGRIRSGPDSAWMPFEADQQSFVDEPTRLFLMRARMFGLPVEAFHRFVDGRATMQVKVLGIVPMVDASGPVMDQSETVTLFNDICLLSPAALLDSRIEWDAVDSHSARARFTNGAQSITATLLFDDEGLLTNFISDDRSRLSSDGKSFTRHRFSTPVRDYRDFGAVRIPAHGDARFLLPEGEFTYGEFDLQDVAYNVAPQH
jgi:hypothetical protein